MMQYHLLNGICFWGVNLPREFQDSWLLLKIMSNPLGLGLGLGVMSNPLGFLYFRFFPPTAGSILAGPHKMFTVDCVPAQLPDCPLLKHIDLPLGCPNLLVQLLQAVKRLKWPAPPPPQPPPGARSLGKHVVNPWSDRCCGARAFLIAAGATKHSCSRTCACPTASAVHCSPNRPQWSHWATPLLFVTFSQREDSKTQLLSSHRAIVQRSACACFHVLFTHLS